MGRVSGMEISSSQGLKKPPKISPREEKLSSQGPKTRRHVEHLSHSERSKIFSVNNLNEKNEYFMTKFRFNFLLAVFSVLLEMHKCMSRPKHMFVMQ